MSKHTSKVHGKLNFLIVAVVLVIGAVSYLLVTTDATDFNPSQLSGSGDKSIKGVEKAKKYDNRNDVVVNLDGEEVQEFLNNQDFQKMIANPEFAKLISSADFQKMMAAPDFQKMMAAPDFQKMMARPDFQKMLSTPDFQKRIRSADY